MAIQEKTTARQDYLDVLANFVADTGYSDIPEQVRKHAKHVWMDTVGVIMSGSLEPENAAFAQKLSDDRGQSTILRQGFPRSDARNAALANGTAGTFLELDEGHHPTGHPAIYVVPAVLALGEKTGATGKQLIEALVLGYEVTARLSWATKFVPGMHIHGCLGVAGAAVGAAKLLGFDASRVREALNVASSLNGATPLEAALEGALVRNVFAGFSAHMGLLSADLVVCGFTGLRDGFAETYTRLIAHSFDPDRMVTGLGEDYQITSNYFKMHAACRHVHPPLDALAEALNGRSILPQEVEQVTVSGNASMVMCGRPDPANSLAAKFSIPFAVASSITRHTTGIDGFRMDAVGDEVTRELAQRVKMQEDSGYDARFPEEHPARVEIELTSGERLVGEVDDPVGDHASPISYEQLKGKFRDLTGPIFPSSNVDKAIDLFAGLDDLQKAGDLTAALKKLSG